MPVLGIGTDIVQVSRIERLLDKHGESFAQRILHKNELQVFQQRKASTHYLAKRFAAKEALAKALGTGIAEGISFEQIEVINNKEGKPELILHETALEKANQRGVKNLFISLSDEKRYAIAYVILEG